MADEECIKALLKFSNGEAKRIDGLTEDYKHGVQDAISRIEYLRMCEKRGAGDEESWLIMDTYTFAITALELLIGD